jgi:dimeric dUTPase (all-alpha-NTP-PPase superfamily)
MNLEELYQLQIELDRVIVENLGLQDNFNSFDYVDKRVFALKVELGEFSNEVGWFKYWKRSHVMDREKTLEELADVIHFFLSVGISRKYTFIKEANPEAWSKVPLQHLFRYLMENNYDSSGKWINGFEQLICIGLKLDYTIDEILQAYRDKREENFRRQERKY